MKNVFICSAKRTPLGSFGGVFSKIKATQLGSIAIKGALESSGIDIKDVDEVFFGNVCSANLGQAPARQAALGAGIGNNVPCTTINKVCSSGMKTIMLGAQSIMLGINEVVVAGGMENMSDIPFYAPSVRWGAKYGNTAMVDGLSHDGLTDAFQHIAMGNFADATASKYEISREEQDAYAIQSYKRSAESTASGAMSDEIIAVPVPQRKGDPVMITEDEEYKKVMFEKIPGLRGAFSKEGTVTAANASTINDGAAAVILASEEYVKKHNLTPMAKIVGFTDAAHEPEWFTTAPTKAANKLLANCNLTIADIDYFEVNEAFSVVALVFAKIMGISQDKMNVHGGAVSLGHPLGASGARIVATLSNVLKHKKGTLGMAAICNGGGGASAMIIESL